MKKLNQLLTETNTRRVELAIIKAATVKFGRGKTRRVFEHGQWWVLLKEGSEVFAVVDAIPGIAYTGLGFEQCS